MTLRSTELRRRVRSGAVYGYDLEVRIGLERFVRHRQRLEIQSRLAAEGIEVSTGQISTLAMRFVAHLERLHWQRAPVLRQAIESDGGYIAHMDATTEDGRGTLFVIYDSWTEWVLGAWKLSTERAELMQPCLREAVRAFGTPSAIMRDLGRAVIKAAGELRTELEAHFPILGCHRHFLSDVGRDLLEESHDQLREAFRKAEVISELRKLSRELGLRLSPGLAGLRADIAAWSESGPAHALPAGPSGVAIIRAMAQFVVDYEHDSTYGSFPYDRPYLDLYRRCLTVRRSVDAFFRAAPEDVSVRRFLSKLAQILDPVFSAAIFATTTETLARRAALFDELRDALRLVPRAKKTCSGDVTGVVTAILNKTPIDVDQAAAELQDIQRNVESLEAALRERRPERGPAQDERQAIDLILDHLDRHGESLWGHKIALPNGTVRMAPRTNNDEEGFFRRLKQAARKRSGRKNLAHDFESLPAAAALACNLTNERYVHILCGSLDNLPYAFAELDAETENAAGPHPLATRGPEDGVTSASLPRIDRSTIRVPGFRKRLEAAARSRAPRYQLGSAK